MSHVVPFDAVAAMVRHRWRLGRSRRRLVTAMLALERVRWLLDQPVPIEAAAALLDATLDDQLRAAESRIDAARAILDAALARMDAGDAA